MALDIDERHLLRLGHGEEELATEKDFSRYGRVNFILALRMELLKEVERLQVGQASFHSTVLVPFPTVPIPFHLRRAWVWLETSPTRARPQDTSSYIRSWQDGRRTPAR